MTTAKLTFLNRRKRQIGRSAPRKCYLLELDDLTFLYDKFTKNFENWPKILNKINKATVTYMSDPNRIRFNVEERDKSSHIALNDAKFRTGRFESESLNSFFNFLHGHWIFFVTHVEYFQLD